MNYVAASLAVVRTNFVSSQTLSVNVGSSAGRFVVGVATATNGDGSGSRSLTAQTYGGNALTASSVSANTFAKFSQLVRGATTLTGANNLVVNATNDSGEIVLAGAAFDGLDAVAPISGIVHAAADNSSPSWTVSSASGETVYAMVVELGTQSTLTPGTGATVVATVDAGTMRIHLLREDGAASVTIGGTFPGTRSWTGWAFSLRAASAGSGSLTGSLDLDAIAPTGTLGLAQSVLGASTLVLDAIAPTGTLGVAPASVTTLPFSRNTGSRPTGLTSVALAVLSDDANLTRLAGATSLAQDGSGRITYTGVDLPAVGTSVLVLTREADGKLGVERYTVQ